MNNILIWFLFHLEWFLAVVLIFIFVVGFFRIWKVKIKADTAQEIEDFIRRNRGLK